jgi:hypothetical protein
MKKLNYFLMTVALFWAPLVLTGQDLDGPEQKVRFSIETDPATFVFNGYAVHLRVQPKTSEHLLVGAGIYAMDMPSFLVDLNGNNKGKGWDVRLNQGLGLFAEHHFSEVNKKWFVGTQIGIQQYEIENEEFSGSAAFSNVLLMGYGGYTWQPFSFPLYLKAWGGLGYTSKMSGENTLDGIDYDIAPITMFATLHVGYSF